MTDGELTSKGNDARAQAARGTALLSIRQVLVGLITVAGIIALPLLLGPADFSLYGYVNMIVLLGAAIGDLGLGAYLIKHEVSRRQLQGMLGLQLLFWTSSGVFLMLLALAVDPFGFSSLTYGLLCAGLVLFSLQSLPTALLEKRLAFRQISTLEVIQRVLLVGLAIFLAVFEPSEWAIPFSALVAAAALYPIFLWLANWPGLPILIRGEPLFRGFASEWWQTRIANQLAYAAFPLLGGLLFTAGEVGLLIWALSISLIPGYLAPMAARAIYPTMARSGTSERIAIHELVLRGLLLVGTPIVVVMFVAAPPITEAVFGQPWTDAVPSLRVLLITSFLGIGLSTVGPLAFLQSKPSLIKWCSLFSTILIFVLGFIFSLNFSLLAIPIANVFSSLFLLAALELALRASTHYSPLRVALPAVTGLLVGLGFGVAANMWFGDGVAISIVIAILAALIQLSVTWSLGGGTSIRALQRQLGLLNSAGRAT